MFKRRNILLFTLSLFVAIQFIRPPKNAAQNKDSNGLADQFGMPAFVKRQITVSCSDCHSNTTVYPWYSNVQPLGWLLAKHINDGKENLNFDEFAAYSKRRQLSKLKSLKNSVEEESMPLWSYTLLHPQAKLSAEQKTLLSNWASSVIDSLTQSARQ
jgi:hypothetical protein